MILIHCGDNHNFDHVLTVNESFDKFKKHLVVGQYICTKDKNTKFIRVWKVTECIFKNNFLDSFGTTDFVLWKSWFKLDINNNELPKM